MAQLLADENFPLPVVLELRHIGHDVVTLQQLGLAGQGMPDDAVLALASREGRAVLTLNRRHFIRLHLLSSEHGGIIACTFDPDWRALALRIDAEVQSGGDLAGRLVRVNRPAR